LERDFVTLCTFADPAAEITAQPVTIRFVEGVSARRYTPDFLVRWHDGRIELVEVKYRAAAAEAGLRAPTVHRMLRHGAEYGLAALLASAVKGVSLTGTQADEIGHCLRTSRRPRRGQGAWRAELVQMEAFRRFGVKISKGDATELLQIHVRSRSNPAIFGSRL
jgi:transposase